MFSCKRLLDFILSLLLIGILSPLFLVAALMVKLTSKGSVLHWSKRVGKDNELFLMPKFRSMQMETPQVATHLMSDPSGYLTPVGVFCAEPAWMNYLSSFQHPRRRHGFRWAPTGTLQPRGSDCVAHRTRCSLTHAGT